MVICPYIHLYFSFSKEKTKHYPSKKAYFSLLASMLSFISSIAALLALSTMSVPAVNAQITCPPAGSTAGAYSVSSDGLSCQLTCNAGYQLTPDSQYCIPLCSGTLSADGLICSLSGVKHYLNPQMTIWEDKKAYDCEYVKYAFEKMGGLNTTYTGSSGSCCGVGGSSCNTGTNTVYSIAWSSNQGLSRSISPTLGYLTGLTRLYIYY